jgi:acyl carrier protein
LNKDKFIQAFSEALMISKDKIVDDLKYQGITEWDSISHMVLITELEDTFDISISTDDVIAMSSVKIAKEILFKYGVEF